MTTATLIGRSLRFYWRTHLGVVLGAALGTLVLTGALLVGDSVKATLRRQAEERVGRADSAMLGGDRFFTAGLAQTSQAAPVLLVRGSVARADGKARINQAQVLGVTPAFAALGRRDAGWVGQSNAAVLNRRLAGQLGAQPGDTLIVRIEKPSNFSKDAPLSGAENDAVALRVPVGAVVDGEEFGNFSLQANQVPPSSIFLPLEYLQERLGQKDGANLLLSGRGPDALREAVQQHWKIADASLQVRALEKGNGTELRTNRVFLDPPVEQAAPGGGVPALTYLVNEIRSGENAVPYSMATAVDTAAAGLLPEPLAEGEAAISQWVADDEGIGVGARVTLKYFMMGERRELTERSADFTVKAVLPMSLPQLDSAWMPDFPGLSDKKNCRDWEPGFAMDTGKIRDQDEQYWKTYRGTPKVFIGLAAGQRLWANRWGRITSIRYPATMTPAALSATLLARLDPQKLGLSFVPLRQQALAATDVPVDFGELFLYFSFFLLIAAAVLTGLLFVFALEQRNDEAGLLLALGWRPGAVRRLLLIEGLMLSVVGSVLGTLAAVLYTRLVLHALATVWRQAAGGADFAFSARPMTLGIGLISGVLMAMLAMWLASRRQLRQNASALMASAGALDPTSKKRRRSWSGGLAIGAAVLATGLLAVPAARTPEGFFGVGSLLLIAGIAACLTSLRRQAAAPSQDLTLPRLGRRNAARRRGRSVTTIAVLASGVFMVVAVDAFRQRQGDGVAERASGTGGFALIGESALPIYEDLNSSRGRESFAFNEKTLAGVSVVPFRVKDGDDASCLNLNRAIQPRLMGEKPSDLAGRGAFHFAETGASWVLLEQPGEPIPGIVDATTLEWALKAKIGDTVEFRDERGAPFQVRLAASVTGSVLQGSVVIAEPRFVEKYPGSGGYRYFLIDAPADRIAPVREELSRALTDRGFEVTPAARRLADFQAVENTYLSIFQALGGLGLLLGSVGLAIVVGRNVLERRGEFGLLVAVGFRPRQLRQLVLAEHRWLIVCGLVIGTLSALVGVWPSLRERAAGFPWREMSLLLLALALGAAFWTWLATRLALRRDQLAALRNE